MTLNSSQVSAGDIITAAEHQARRLDILEQAGEYRVSTGSSNAYVVADDAQISGLVAGQTVVFKANFANTGASTLAYGASGAIAIKLQTVDGLIDTFDGCIVANEIYMLKYDGTQWLILAPCNIASLLNREAATDVTKHTGAFILDDDTVTSGVRTYLTPDAKTPVLGGSGVGADMKFVPGSTTTGVIITRAGGSDPISARVFSVSSSGVVSFGSSVQLDSDGSGGYLAVLSATRFAVLVRGISGLTTSAHVIVGTISGTSISSVVKTRIDTSVNDAVAGLVRVTDTTFMALGSFGGDWEAVIGTVNTGDNTCSFGSYTSVEATITYADIIETEGGDFLLAYPERAQMFTVSGTSITAGTRLTISGDSTVTGGHRAIRQIPGTDKYVIMALRSGAIYPMIVENTTGTTLVLNFEDSILSSGNVTAGTVSFDFHTDTLGTLYAVIYFINSDGKHAVAKTVVTESTNTIASITASEISVYYDVTAETTVNANVPTSKTWTFDDNRQLVLVCSDDTLPDFSLVEVRPTIDQTIARYIGVFLEGVSATEQVSIATRGRIITGLSGLTSGDILYIDSDDFTLTDTESEEGIVAGIAVSATSAIVNQTL